ncbi:MAG: ATP-binding protein [Spirochaetaceae bacterium]|jgi:two-component system NarL family sensor kinase|nr:ATP-binding protein [Spirochaetaceae bacterium]
MPQDLLSEVDAYFRLSWTFAGIIAVSAVLMMLLYVRKRRAEMREEQSVEVSFAVIQGQEEERRRVAGELHDAILPELGLLAQAVRAGNGEAALERQRAVSGGIRGLCARLLPPDFDRLSFKETLLALNVSFSERAMRQSAGSGEDPAEFRTAIDEGLDLGRLDAENRLAIYRIVQEALTNCEKHARGPVVLVARNSAAKGEKTLLICVSDHGPGIDPAAAAGSLGKEAPPGLGLRIMRLRAAALGASLDFVSEEGNGLMVRLELPISPQKP